MGATRVKLLFCRCAITGCCLRLRDTLEDVDGPGQGTQRRQARHELGSGQKRTRLRVLNPAALENQLASVGGHAFLPLQQIRPMIESIPLAPKAFGAAEAYGRMMRNESLQNRAGHQPAV